MKKCFFIISLVCIVINASAQVDTFEVRFNLNDPKLTSKSEEYIDQLLYQNKIHRGLKLIILGYADYIGSEDDNMALSEKRAANVRAYLIASGFKNEDVNVCVGKGEIANTTTDKIGKPDDRKVQLIIDKGKTQGKGQTKMNGTSKNAAPIFDIAALKENDVVPMDHVFFGSGSYELTEESYYELGKLRSFLAKNPSVHVKIEGHICCGTGLDGLSGKRAKAVYDFLVGNGIDSTRMAYVGLGTTRPFVRERTKADEAKNRRVAIRILKK